MPTSSVFRELMGEPRFISGALSNPMVSFLCPTHGRVALEPHLMNEMVYWYRMQTYTPRELLILNDVPGQTIVCDEPGVRIVNFPYRIGSLGDKRNLLTMIAAGPVCLPQDDDDISLPWRAEQAVMALANAEYWSPHLYWFAQKGRPVRADSAGVGHNCSAYRRQAMLNRYPLVNGCEDKLAHEWAMKNLKVNPIALTDPKDISYVYRWGVSRHHLSGYSDMDAAYHSMPAGPAGEYRIVPQIYHDWEREHMQLTEPGPV